MPPSDTSFTGKTCLITGGTSGIGLVTAEALASKGYNVFLVARDPKKGAEVVEKIRKSTGNPAVEFLLADLSRQTDIRKLASDFLARSSRLDVLVNNAGAIFAKREVTADGLEKTFALNHLAYFLLTNLLLDALKAAAPSRVVNVSSDAHRFTFGIPWDDLQSETRYGGFRNYSQSKLANLLFTKELALRLEGTGVTVNALHPGVVSTGILFGNGAWGRLWRTFSRPFEISPIDGARTTIYLATSPEVADVSGAYFEKMKIARPSKLAQDAASAKRLWQESERLVGLATREPSR